MPVAALGRMPKSTPGRPIRLCGRNLGRSFPPGEMCSAAYQERDGSPARLFRRVRKTGIIRAAISEIKNENLDKNNIKYISFIFDSEDADLLIDNIGYSN